MAPTAEEVPLEAHWTRDKEEGSGYGRPTPCFFALGEPWETC